MLIGMMSGKTSFSSHFRSFSVLYARLNISKLFYFLIQLNDNKKKFLSRDLVSRYPVTGLRYSSLITFTNIITISQNYVTKRKQVE